MEANKSPGQNKPSLPPSSSLEPLETNPPPPPKAYIPHAQGGSIEFCIQSATKEEQEFRHSHWAGRRWKVYAALNRCHVGTQRISRFANCGAGAWIQWCESEKEARIVCDKCKDRFCASCGSDRAARITEALAVAMTDQSCRFMTLTLRHSQTPLSAQIDRLYLCFSTLRRRAFWKDSVAGGAAFLEVKLSKTGLWHPHLHIICSGSFIDQKRLSQEWHAVTGDSSIVDIRAISDVEGRARYVTKYVTKPAPTEVFERPDKLDEMICAMRGRRLCLTFGKWRGICLEGELDDERSWVTCGPVGNVVTKALEGDATATAALNQLSRKHPGFFQWIDSFLDGLPPPWSP